MNKGKILIATKVHSILPQTLSERGFEVLHLPQINYREGLQKITDCIGVITANNMVVDKTMIDQATQLQFIARMGSGMEIIDVDYAKSKQIQCFGSPDGNSKAVAEHALGLLIALNKNIVKSNAELINGQWLREENRGTELESKTIAIIGYGHTGKALAKLLSGFEMNILVYDKYITPNPASYIEICTDLNKIYAEADIVSLHVPLRQDTYHIVNEDFIQRMQKPFMLLNTSRGTVVDASILKPHLFSKKILGIALDVWEEEPLEKMGEKQKAIFEDLVKQPQVLITPHIAGYSSEALYKMSSSLLKQIIL